MAAPRRLTLATRYSRRGLVRLTSPALPDTPSYQPSAPGDRWGEGGCLLQGTLLPFLLSQHEGTRRGKGRRKRKEKRISRDGKSAEELQKEVRNEGGFLAAAFIIVMRSTPGNEPQLKRRRVWAWWRKGGVEQGRPTREGGEGG